jgi:hypothetical protein
MPIRITLRERGSILQASLLATAILGFIAFMGILVIPLEPNAVADMRLEPLTRTVAVGDTFTVSVVVEAKEPVNVFAGELLFDTDTLAVAAIDYNTSIADLWAERPWYSNGDGTLNFAGGTTHPGGFTGTAELLTVTFKAKAEGAGTLAIRNAQILRHDGLGSNAPLEAPIDALFTVESTTTAPANLLTVDNLGSRYTVMAELPSTDLNGDGKQSIADTSILLLHIGSTDARYDLNGDGAVDLRDLNIILGAR